MINVITSYSIHYTKLYEVVRDLLVIERYSHVMHIVSGVHGKLAKDKDQFDVLESYNFV